MWLPQNLTKTKSVMRLDQLKTVHENEAEISKTNRHEDIFTL
jgi:hypothetical protein